MKPTLWFASLALATAWLQTFQDEPAPIADARVEFLELDDLRAEAELTDRTWTPFLDRPSLHCGIYRLRAGSEDGQSPHADDEVYVVLAGKARLSAGRDEQRVEAGSTVFVERGVPHRFHDIEEDLEVLVFFSRYRPHDEDE